MKNGGRAGMHVHCVRVCLYPLQNESANIGCFWGEGTEVLEDKGGMETFLFFIFLYPLHFEPGEGNTGSKILTIHIK